MLAYADVCWRMQARATTARATDVSRDISRTPEEAATLTACQERGGWGEGSRAVAGGVREARVVGKASLSFKTLNVLPVLRKVLCSPPPPTPCFAEKVS